MNNAQHTHESYFVLMVNDSAWADVSFATYNDANKLRKRFMADNRNQPNYLYERKAGRYGVTQVFQEADGSHASKQYRIQKIAR